MTALPLLGLGLLLVHQLLRRARLPSLKTGLAFAAALLCLLRATGLLHPLLPREREARSRSLAEELVLGLDGLPEVLRLLLGDLLGAGIALWVLRRLSDSVSAATAEDLLARVKQLCFDAVKWLPVVQARLDKERKKLEDELEKDLKQRSKRSGLAEFRKLPLKGVDPNDILTVLKAEAARDEANWGGGKVSGTVYLGDSRHTELLNAAFGLYSLANSLHPETWPSGMRLEAEVDSLDGYRHNPFTCI